MMAHGRNGAAAPILRSSVMQYNRPGPRTPSDAPNEHPDTRLVRAGRPVEKYTGVVNPPLIRGSTVLQPDTATRRREGKRWLEQSLIYGLNGSETHFALENAIAEIEGGTHCQIVSSGLAACTVPLLGYLSAGDHLLVPDMVYGPTRDFCEGLLKQFGIETTFYTATATAHELAPLFRPETRVLFLESPGSHTFEVQDVAALCALAHQHGAVTMLDNTWGIRHFQPFQHGIDLSIQALTKYVGGHSDLLLGSITVNDEAHWRRVRSTAGMLGQYASPDDCWLALRGLRTMAVRMNHQMQSALHIATFLSERPEIQRVLYPALPGDSGYEMWKRDFTGAPSLFGVEFKSSFTTEQSDRFIDSLSIFGLGASWGGYESLIMPTYGTIHRSHDIPLEGPTVRIHIGLEDPQDLIADLTRALDAMQR
ncbi:Cystathionine beta-lyase [Granulibacter bethesdensis CGDNIH4]|nr:Cystathionine beta-lyase [Granulibacter bethesdensis CGDNIH4]